MIHFTDVYKSYGEIPALSGLTFSVRKGEIFGLLGPNGAGKTTTVHILAGILTPDAGQVKISEPAIGLVPQALAIYDQLTAIENLRFFGQLSGITGKLLNEQVQKALQFVQLEAYARRRVASFSGGMKRRLNLAAALIHNPKILILDEPTVGIDPQSRNAIFENILQLKEQGMTIIYTTHYMEEAQRLCDRVAIIDHGKLLALDTVQELIEKYGRLPLLEVETERGVQTFHTDQPLEVLQKLSKEETVLGFQLKRADLEQVFLNLTGHSLRDEA